MGDKFNKIVECPRCGLVYNADECRKCGDVEVIKGKVVVLYCDKCDEIFRVQIKEKLIKRKGRSKFKVVINEITKNISKTGMKDNSELNKVFKRDGVIGGNTCKHYKERIEIPFCKLKLRGIKSGECRSCKDEAIEEERFLEFDELEKGKLYKRVIADEKLDFVRIRVNEEGFLEVRYKGREDWDFESLKVSKQLKEMRFMEVKKDEV